MLTPRGKEYDSVVGFDWIKGGSVPGVEGQLLRDANRIGRDTTGFGYRETCG